MVIYFSKQNIKMKIIITEEQKKKLFIPRKIDERELELKKKIQEIINSEHFQDDLEQHIREWWPEISDFDEWLDENGWERDYINGDSYEQLGEEIADYIEVYNLIEFDYDLIDFSHYINNSELVITKLKEMGYL